MKYFARIFLLSFTLCTYFTNYVLAETTENCTNLAYRQANPEKCDEKSFWSDDSATMLSGAAIVSSAFALLGVVNSYNNSSYNNFDSADTSIQPTLPLYNMVGGDVDAVKLANAAKTNEYQLNVNQYNDIRLAYSLARGFTGKNTTIAVLDAGLDSWHGASVAAIASGPIAPDATVNSYKIANNNEFISYNEIGNIISSATDADIFNASWSVSMRAPALKSRTQLIQLTGQQFVDGISDAAKRGAIFVWAAGNDYDKRQSSALSALPKVMPELQGHFINVVAWDSYTGALAEYSNACGITKDYCITAPGTNINSGETTASGTSFAAPIVSAAVAVIKEAFPYMSSPEITELLFTTARDLGEPGIDNIYGHGMLDLERATRPVGAPMVPIESGIMQPLQTARVSGTIAHKINSADLKFAFFDSFGRAFEANLADNISIQNPGRAFQRLQNQETLTQVSIGNLEFGLKNSDIIFGDGFLEANNQDTISFIGTYNEANIGDITLFQNARFGISSPKASPNSMITGFSNIYTASIKLGAKFKDWTFSWAIPDNIIAGNMGLRLPSGRANNGDILYQNYSLDLSSKPAIEYAISYKNIHAGFIDNPYGTDEIFILTKGSLRF